MERRASTIETQARKLVDAIGSQEPGAFDKALSALEQAVVEDGKNTELSDQYRTLAQEQWHRGGEIEVDDDAIVSISENSGGILGAYVAAWVFVDNPDWEKEGLDGVG